MLSSVLSVLSSTRDNAYLAVRGLAMATTPAIVAAVVCFSCTLLLPATSFATELTAEINIGALSSQSGFVATNITAGNSNIQQNSAAFSASTDVSEAGLFTSQLVIIPPPPAGIEQSLTAKIDAGAFDDSLGVIMVNQSSGANNTQFNGVAIAAGEVTLAFIELRDDALAEAVTVPNPGGTPVEDFSLTQTQTSLSPTAFANASGAVQINQVAGNLNATSNSFAMSVSQ